jgi:hypothetical protein
MIQKCAEKSTENFICKLCDYKTSRRSQYNRHLLTQKHKNNENDTKDTKKVPKSSTGYLCVCGKKYQQKQNLYRHKKTCTEFLEENNLEDIIENTNDEKTKELIFKLVEENSEIKNLMFKQFETMQNQISELIPRIGNNNTVTNKQKFNINIFLNEHCKDALTMEEFIKKIQVTVDNLSVTKDKGLSEGVSNIFIENMKKLSLYERPMHCTDSKRETIYIKYEDKDNIGGENNSNGKWFKDDDNKKLKNVINTVTHIQRKNLDKWIEDHPEWETNQKLQNEYLLLVKNCTEDLRENNNENKIIRKVCNEINLPNGSENDELE